MKTQKPAKKRRAICQEKKEGKEEEEEEEKEAKAKLERVVPILLSRWRVSLATAPAGSGRPLSEAPTFLRQSRWHQIASGRGRQQQQQIKENARPPFEPFHFSESLLFFFCVPVGDTATLIAHSFLAIPKKEKILAQFLLADRNGPETKSQVSKRAVKNVDDFMATIHFICVEKRIIVFSILPSVNLS